MEHVRHSSRSHSPEYAMFCFDKHGFYVMAGGGSDRRRFCHSGASVVLLDADRRIFIGTGVGIFTVGRLGPGSFSLKAFSREQYCGCRSRYQLIATTERLTLGDRSALEVRRGPRSPLVDPNNHVGGNDS